MSMLSYQADNLRNYAERLNHLAIGQVNQGFPARQDLLESATEMYQAANTIESLSVKSECELEEVDAYDSAGEPVHVLECSACGETCEHINGGYEYCPHCGRKAVE